MVEINKPVTNPDLVAAMKAFKEIPSPDAEALFVHEMKKAHFLSTVIISPRPEPDANGQTALKEQTTIEFLALDDAAGKRFLPVFTDWIELKKWHDNPDEQTLITTYEDLRALIMQDDAHDGFCINPYDENIVITRDLMKRFQGPQPLQSYTVEKETEVLIGMPKEYPKTMTDAISNYLKTQRNVKSAYLVLMSKDGEESFLIAVDFKGDRRTTFNGIASVAIPHLKQGQFIDMIPIADGGIGVSIEKDYQPFYRRKVLGLF